MTLVGRPVRNGPPPLASIVVGLAAGQVNAWVLALLSLNLGASSLGDAALLGILMWLGFLATLSAATVGFEGRPWSLWLLNNVHHLILQVVMAVIVTLWR
jgi:ABC-type multidrug transport system permease subunit